MVPPTEEFTIGVEEEFQIIDPETRELAVNAEKILALTQHVQNSDVQPEIYRSQIEIATPICHTLADVRSQLTRLRGVVLQAATAAGSQIAAAGTHPFSSWVDQTVTPKERYEGLVMDYQQLMRELVIFGCHVHVGLSDRDIAVQVMNRARFWLTPLLALSANSPFWLGVDTGYASFRRELWGRWPTGGPPLNFKSYREYRELIQALMDTGTIKDGTKVYWDIRLSERFPTIEFRVTDVCATIDEAVMIAGLTRALVQTCYDQVMEKEPLPNIRPELLRAADWHAARYGLEENLVDVEVQQAIPASQLLETFLTFVRPSLEKHGDWEEISSLVHHTLQRGTGSTRQRQVYTQTGRLQDVVDLIVAETAEGVV